MDSINCQPQELSGLRANCPRQLFRVYYVGCPKGCSLSSLSCLSYGTRTAIGMTWQRSPNNRVLRPTISGGPRQITAHLLACLLTHSPACLPACLPARSPARPPAGLLAFPHARPPACLPTCLPTGLPAHQLACLPCCTCLTGSQPLTHPTTHWLN